MQSIPSSALDGEEGVKGQSDGEDDNMTHTHVLTKGVAKENHYGNGVLLIIFCDAKNILHFRSSFGRALSLSSVSGSWSKGVGQIYGGEESAESAAIDRDPAQ